MRILTGAPVPAGCDRVLPQELVALEGEALVLAREASANPWIRAADEEAAPGAVLLEAAMRLGPAQLGRLASCGVPELRVRPQPRVGLLISGEELTPVGEALAPGAIWESNGTLLEALLARLGYGVAERCDVVVSTRGVSAGDADWIRTLVADLGEVNFWKLFLKPGRPFAFGQLRLPLF